MPKFTPGDWKTGDREKGSMRIVETIRKGKNKLICKTNVGFGISIAEGVANARLIAKAPAMYAILKRLSESDTIKGSIGEDIIKNLLSEIDGGE